MLDLETRERIDRLRDILVGKIPDPKAQVEQITTGLIYKFMNDIDDQSLESGGKASFFIGDYKKYSWSNLFNPKLTGVDKVNLYSEAIERMYLNSEAPQIFRDIFKNAFLPFRDPSTLDIFLKEIGEFHYSHSEKLGDAYEYLLSTMSAQGDAGQFRTPRHLIDFIVEIVNPKKNESILDPSCGSSGFLISSYKNILKENTKKIIGDNLSATDLEALGKNLTGYDIDPAMVRISLVNMYLNGFVSPQISEYDTISEDEKWNEYFDVILANPPFFNPKEITIKPHSKFSITSKKSALLFLDYIFQHLKPNSRAGIVIPQGILFDATSKANIFIRKKIVEEGLMGVISLPQNVFKPYSGVKTSILIIDKVKSKSRKSIFFAKINNDGFSLNDKREPINKNDLPDIYLKVCGELKSEDSIEVSEDFLRIPKNKINSHKSTSLLSDDYFRTSIEFSGKHKTVLIKDICEVIPGQSPKKKYYNETGEGLPFYQGKNDFGEKYLKTNNIFTSKVTKVSEVGDILLSVRAPVGPVNLSPFKLCIGRGLCALRPGPDVDLMYLFYLFQSFNFFQGRLGSTTESINKDDIKNIEIPLPPLNIQKEISKKIEYSGGIITEHKTMIEAEESKIKDIFLKL